MSPAPTHAPDALLDTWTPRLLALCDRIRSRTRAVAREAHASGDLGRLSRPVGRGVGDVVYGLDVPAEELIDSWARDEARRGPLSVLTEETGWRHHGATATAGADAFDHGGPRIVFDPVDGTRNLMADLRSAWTVVAFAGPGAGVPRLADVVLGVVAEIPDTRSGGARVLLARRGGGVTLQEHTGDGEVDDGPAGTSLAGTPLVADADDRADNGYFPFFRYMPDLRPALAEVEARFFDRLQRLEGADVRNCYDDQYISNAGQLVLLTLGTYRMIADLRAFLGARRGTPTVTSKPYDVAGAILCAREAGAVVLAPDGGELDFPLDATTPVSFVGFANAPTARRLLPHLRAALED